MTQVTESFQAQLQQVTLSQAPLFAPLVFYNGMLQLADSDYVLSGQILQFFQPIQSNNVQVIYWVAAPI